MSSTDTIIALATAVGNSAINIIRISGDRAHEIVSSIFTAPTLNLHNITYRYMHLGTLSCKTISDKCFCVYFKSPQSYTGEDMVELQCHGGAKLADSIIRELLPLGCRIATNGEFTKRAFVNGKVSLSQAEGIIDMINAESTASLRSSYRMMQGSIGETIGTLRSKLVDVMASLEASFDYPEEMEEEATASGSLLVSEIVGELNSLLSTAQLGRYIRGGINIAIVGAPNAGKSSLLNRIIGQDKAIVTDIAGTTRDTIEARMEYNGILLNFIDTAGIRESSDVIEKIGIDKARAAIKNCDAAILMVDVSCETLQQNVQELISLAGNTPCVLACNKCDKLSGDNASWLKNIEPIKSLLISARENINIDTLLTLVINLFDINMTDTTQEVLTQPRHIDCLVQVHRIMTELAASYNTIPIECALIDMGKAYELFGEINGESAREDIIDRIFDKFCLGK